MRACKTTVMTEFCNKKLTKKYAKIVNIERYILSLKRIESI